MIGSLHKSRLLVSIACRSTISCRSSIYRLSQYGDRDSDTVSGGTVDRRRRNTRVRVRRVSFANDDPSESPESTSADEIPNVVKKMRERMREKYGLANVNRDNDIADDTFVESESVDNVKHTASHRKHESRKHHGLVDNSFTDGTGTEPADQVNPSEYKDLFEKFSFLKKNKVADKVMDMTFGVVRLDTMNQPLHHGERDRFDLHEDNLDSGDGFEVSNPLRHTKQDHTSPESMASDTWQQSNPYSDTMHAKYDDHVDNQAFSERDSSHKTQCISDNYIEEQYFGTSDLSSDKAQTEPPSESASDNIFEKQYFGTTDLSNPPETEQKSVSDSDNFIENQYFGYNQLSSDKQQTPTRKGATTGDVFGQCLSSTKSRLPKMPSGEAQPSKPPITDHTEQLSKRSTTGSDRHITSNAVSSPPDHSEGNLFDSQYFSDEMLTCDESHSPRSQDVNSVKHMNSTAGQSSTIENRADATSTKADYFGTMTKQEKRQRNQPVPDLQKPQTAFDLAMKIRLEKKGKLPVDENEGL